MATDAGPDDDGGYLSREMGVEPEWIDYNGHLNMAYYNVLFDRGMDDLWDAIGMGEDYQATRGMTTYTAEAQVRYLREIHQDARLRVRTIILDHDVKRLHTWAELVHADGWVGATCEVMTLSIDQRGDAPKVAPWPDDIAANIGERAAHDAQVNQPAEAGRPIAIRRR
ncbi:MAG: thioesterase family protein [Pseudomonadota bacterium]